MIDLSVHFGEMFEGTSRGERRGVLVAPLQDGQKPGSAKIDPETDSPSSQEFS